MIVASVVVVPVFRPDGVTVCSVLVPDGELEAYAIPLWRGVLGDDGFHVRLDFKCEQVRARAARRDVDGSNVDKRPPEIERTPHRDAFLERHVGDEDCAGERHFTTAARRALQSHRVTVDATP